ncbi:MAG: efflux transporter periplasmic adaptor subunit [Pseudomonadota bacterium]
MTRLLRVLAQAVLPALVLFGAFFATSALLQSGDADRQGRDKGAETVYAVAAVDVELGDNRATLRAFGETVAAEEAELRVASPGEVVSIYPDLAVGHQVPEGAALVTIDPFAYRGALRDAEAKLAEAEARTAEALARIEMEEVDLKRLDEQLAFATRDLERAEQLALSGNITDKALDDRRFLVSQRQQALEQNRFAVDAEKAKLDQQMAAVEQLAWQVEKAERALADTVLTAPFTGVVRAESAAVGRLLAANDIAVSLIRADALDVRFVLSDQRYGRLLFEDALFGANAEVIWRIGDIPLTYEATITRAAADIQSTRGGVDVFARLALGDMPAPRPGAFVEVRLPGVNHANSARVPTSAIHGTNVFLVGSDDRLVSVPINVLALDGNDAIIEGELRDGDQVVVTRLAEAGNGIKVRRVDPFGGAPAPRSPTDALEVQPNLAIAPGAAAAPEASKASDSPRDPARPQRRRGDGPPRERS